MGVVALLAARPEGISAAVAARAADGAALEGRRVGVVRREEHAEADLFAEGAKRGLQDGEVGDDDGDEFLADRPLAAGDGAFGSGLGVEKGLAGDLDL